jgi:hypothetical protein
MAEKRCVNESRNLDFCACTYTSCDRRGKCCECLQYHLKNRQLPGCCFPPEVEKTYDRSFQRFVQTHKHLLA